MAEKFDPKFNIDGKYTKADFIFRLETLLLTCNPDPILSATISANIAWAADHPDDTIFAWKVEGNRIVPYATVSVPVSQVPPPNSKGFLN